MRAQVIKELAAFLEKQQGSHPLRVAIDGIDGAGKTTLADELASKLQAHSRETLRSSIDRFHFPRAWRYRKGQLSPEGYFHDSFDVQSLIGLLLKPLGPGGNYRVQTGKFDYLSDQPVNTGSLVVSSNSILLFDGVFLQKPELIPYWDVIIYVKIGFGTSLQRGLQRDSKTMGSLEKTRERYLSRYIPGQKRYIETCQPEKTAHLILINEEPAFPRIVYNKHKLEMVSDEYF